MLLCRDVWNMWSCVVVLQADILMSFRYREMVGSLRIEESSVCGALILALLPTSVWRP